MLFFFLFFFFKVSDFLFTPDFWCVPLARGKTACVRAYTARACGDSPTFEQLPSDFHLRRRGGARDVAHQRREAGTHAVSCHTVVVSVGDVPTDKKKKTTKKQRAESFCFSLIHREIYWILLQEILKQQLKTPSRVDVYKHGVFSMWAATLAVEKMQMRLALNTHPLPGY